MFLPVALEAGVFAPRDSELRPMSVVTSATCCGFPLQVQPSCVQTVVRLVAESSRRTHRPPLGPDGQAQRLTPRQGSRLRDTSLRTHARCDDRHGCDLHRCTTSCCERVNDSVSPALARHGLFAETNNIHSPRDPSAGSLRSSQMQERERRPPSHCTWQ